MPVETPTRAPSYSSLSDLWLANRKCTACPIHEKCKGPVPHQGPQSARIAFVAEAPGAREDETGTPLTGPAGRAFDRWLDRIGVARADVFISNVLKCRPRAPEGAKKSNFTPTTAQARFCADLWLEEELALVQPRLVVALGSTAAKYFLGPDITVDSANGRLFTQGRTGRPFSVFVTYHPAAALYSDGAHLLTEIQDGWDKLGRFLETGEVLEDQYPDPEYIWVEDVDRVEAGGRLRELLSIGGVYGRGPTGSSDLGGVSHVLTAVAPMDRGTVETEGPGGRAEGGPLQPGTIATVAVDVETNPDGSLFCFSMSAVPGTGFVFPVNPPNLRFLGRICRNPAVHKVFHNLIGLDWQTLRKYGIEVVSLDDTMVRLYLLNLVPQGLKGSSLKHLGMEMREYRDVIRDADRDQATEYLGAVASCEWPDAEPHDEQEVDEETGELVTKQHRPRNIGKKALEYLNKAKGTEAVYKKRKVKGVKPAQYEIVLAKAAKEGDPEFDAREAWNRVPAWEKAGVEEVFGPMPLVGLADVFKRSAAERRGVEVYSARDADATLRMLAFTERLIEDRRQHQILDIDLGIIPIVAEMMETGLLVDKAYLVGLAGQWQAQIKQIEEKVQEVAGYKFKVSSPIERAKVLHGKDRLNLPVLAKTPKTQRPKMDADTLTKLKAKHPHPVIDLLLERESLAKLVGTYAGPDSDLVKGIGADGRVHPTLKTTRTGSGRLASENPNSQNIPIRTETGRQVRNAFIAAPGRVLLGADYSQVEMRLEAVLSGDETLIKVFHDGIDIHAYTASQVLGKPVSMITKDERFGAKAVNFGVIYSITAVGLSEGLGWTRDRAQEYLNAWFKLYPGVRAYMEEQKRKVSVLGYVETLYGRRRYFPEYLSVDNRIREKMYKEAVNHPTQGTAADILKIAMGRVYRAIREAGYMTYYTAGRDCDVEWLNQIHDELLCSPWDTVWRDVGRVIKGVMEGAAELAVPLVAELKVGKRWGELEEVKL